MRLITRKQLYHFIISISLLFFGCYLYVGSYNTNFPKEELSSISSKLEIEVNSAEKEIDPILSLIAQVNRFNFSELDIYNTSYPFYIYSEQGDLLYWSTNEYVPNYIDLIGGDDLKFIESRKGKFVCVKHAIDKGHLKVFSLISLKKNSLIENQYLFSQYNSALFNNDDFSISKLKSDKEKQVCLKNNCLFSVEFGNNYFLDGGNNRSIAIALIGVGLLLLIIWSFLVARSLAQKHFWSAIVFLSAALSVIRFTMLQYDFQINAFGNTLFDPQVFASSNVTPTLADLLFNMSLLLAFFGFIFLNLNVDVHFKKLNQYLKILFGFLSGLGLWQLFILLETIYHNSNFTFDITSSVDFSKERILIFAVLLMGCLLFILFSHIVYMIALSNRGNSNRLKLYSFFVLGIVLFGLVLHGIGQSNWLLVVLILVYYFVIEVTDLPLNVNKVSYQSFAYILTGIFISSIMIAFTIKDLEVIKEGKDKQRYAEQFLIGNDALAEYLLLESANGIRNDAFIKSRMFSPFLSKEAAKEKVKKIYLSSYFDKYDVIVDLFDSKGQEYSQEQSIDLITLQNVLKNQVVNENKGLYYLNNYKGEYTKGYVCVTEIKNYGISAGFIVITLKLKKIIPENVYPDLLVDSRFVLLHDNEKFSYAVFVDDEPVYTAGDYNYYQNFKLTNNKNELLNDKGYCHLIISETENRTVVVSSYCYSIFRMFSNFAFLMLIMILLLAVVLLIYGVMFYLSGRSLNYSARIQLYFNWAFFIPLIAISWITLKMVANTYNEEVEYEHYKKALVIARNIENEIGLGLEIKGDEVAAKLKLASTMANIDANLFDIRGRLIASSQPLIYKKNILSEFILPSAQAKIVEEKERSFTAKETVGSLKYNAAYLGIKSPTSGELQAVLSVPYFQSESNLENEMIQVFVTIVNVFLIIFIVFLIISYFASKWLIFPLQFITQKLKATTLSQTNEPLKWQSNDEIGLMVSEYNKMIVNLDESKKALARTEKETAWRTIAQQVAHEIKNPLTPMKLTLQHLQRSLIGEKRDKDLEKPVNSLLRQVDILTDIVTSFSSFAQMPIPEHERYELIELLRNTVALHKNKNIVFNTIPEGELHVMGDQKLMGRIILNMIINAEQSSLNEVIITISLSHMSGNKILLEIKDNGDGISNEYLEKIFIPNFTTKESGSGIGLAIAKHGIEHAGGKLWFETKVGTGTSFFIELPQVS